MGDELIMGGGRLDRHLPTPTGALPLYFSTSYFSVQFLLPSNLPRVFLAPSGMTAHDLAACTQGSDECGPTQNCNLSLEL